MLSGEKSSKIISKVCSELGICEKFSSILPRTFPRDGLYCFREVQGNQFLSEKQMQIKKLKKTVIKRINNLNISVDIDLVNNFFSQSNKILVQFDMVVVEVIQNQISHFRIYEIDGEGHRNPVFGDTPYKRFIETLTSDTIKDQLDIIHIPYFDGNETIFFDIYKQIVKDFDI